MTTRSFWATHDKNEGIRLHLWIDGTHVAVAVSVQEAERLRDKIRETIDALPREASEADLGLVAA